MNVIILFYTQPTTIFKINTVCSFQHMSRNYPFEEENPSRYQNKKK